MDPENGQFKNNLHERPSIDDVAQLLKFGPRFVAQQDTFDYLSNENGNYDVSKIVYLVTDIIPIELLERFIETQNDQLNEEEKLNMLRLSIAWLFEKAAKEVESNKELRSKFKELGLSKISAQQIMEFSARIDNALYNKIGHYKT